MKAAIFEQFQQPLKIQNVPDPILPVDGVVIEVKANGICRIGMVGWDMIPMCICRTCRDMNSPA